MHSYPNPNQISDGTVKWEKVIMRNGARPTKAVNQITFYSNDVLIVFSFITLRNCKFNLIWPLPYSSFYTPMLSPNFFSNFFQTLSPRSDQFEPEFLS